MLKLIIAMDAHKFKIATKQTKGLEKENVDLNVNYTPKQTIWRSLLKWLSACRWVSGDCHAVLQSLKSN